MTRIKGITQKRVIAPFRLKHATKCGIKNGGGGGETVDIELKRRQAVKCQAKGRKQKVERFSRREIY